MEELATLAQAVLELREYVLSISELTIKNSELLLKLQIYSDSIAQFTDKAFTDLASNMQLIGGLVVENASNLEYVQVVLSKLVLHVEKLSLFTVVNFGLGVFNFICIIGLMIAVCSKSKCKCTK